MASPIDRKNLWRRTTHRENLRCAVLLYDSAWVEFFALCHRIALPCDVVLAMRSRNAVLWPRPINQIEARSEQSFPKRFPRKQNCQVVTATNSNAFICESFVDLNLCYYCDILLNTIFLYNRIESHWIMSERQPQSQSLPTEKTPPGFCSATCTDKQAGKRQLAQPDLKTSDLFTTCNLPKRFEHPRESRTFNL